VRGTERGGRGYGECDEYECDEYDDDDDDAA
jgi:hypothetical protein